MKNQLIFLTILSVFFVFQSVTLKAQELKSPYEILKVTKDTDVTETTNCPKTPPAVKNLLFKSIYTNREHGLSIIDKKAQKKYKKQTKPLRYFEQKISWWIEDHQTKGTHLNCAVQWLRDWSKQDALLNNEVSFQGEAIRKWTLAVLSSNYVQIMHSPHISKEDKKIIENWLHRLSEQVIKDYSRYPEKMSRQNNHIYWSAWAVMITSTITNDPDHFRWAKLKFDKAMNQIEKDGTLPHEIFREGKAFNYHVFALGPLLMMAETLEANGKKGYAPPLHRLVRVVLEGLENEQAYFEEKTGVKQDLKGTITAPQLAWIEVYHARFPNDITKKWVDKFRPFTQRRLGGNMTRLFTSDYSDEG